MDCEFCKNKLQNKYILVTHQKTNKKCLDLQQKINNVVIENKLSNCLFCEKSYSIPNLKNHLLVCQKKKMFDIKQKYENKIEEIIKEYENKIEKIINENEKNVKENENKFEEIIKKNENKFEEIRKENFVLRKELEIKDKIYKDEHKTIKKLALQPKTTNIIGNLNLYDTKRIKDILEKEFTPNDILDGQKGLANFAFKNILHDEEGNLVYVCGDSSRKIFKYKDSSGKIIKDVNTQKLTDAIIMSDISKITNVKSQEFWINEDGSQDHLKYSIISNPAAEIMNLKYNNVSFREQLVNLTSS